MDFFVEQLVKRKRTSSDYVKVIICLIAAVVIVAVMLVSIVTVISPFVFLIGILLILFLNKLRETINVEYEYCFTNGALDVDKIIAANRRGRMVDINAREIELMGTRKNPDFRRYLEDRGIEKVYACSSVDDDNVCFVIYDADGKRKMLLFSPNDKIKEGFARYNPRKVNLDD